MTWGIVVVRKKYPLLPERSEYYPATIQSLVSRGGSATIEELEEDVAGLLSLSEEALAIAHGDGRRSQFQYDLAWVRTYLKWAGAVDNSERGVWRLTPEGARMSQDELRGLWRRIVAEQRKKRRTAAAEDEDSEEIEEQVEDSAGSTELFELSWKEQLLSVLATISPDAFERLCQRVLRESGFTKVEVTGRSGDGGIDGVGVLRVNLLSFQVLFQSKRWKGSVGASVVRDFRGAMVGRADKGLIMTTGAFTSDARREATRDGAPAIDLIDGEMFCDLLKSTKVGVDVRLVEHVSVNEAALRVI